MPGAALRAVIIAHSWPSICANNGRNDNGFERATCRPPYIGPARTGAAIIGLVRRSVEHVTKLSSAKSPMEFFALSNEYAKRQFEIFTRQAQELGVIVQKMTIAKDR
jgi:hypothetical protein